MNADSCVVEGAATISCIVPLFESVIKAVVSFGAVALFIMLLVGGFKFLTSGGDPKKLESARGTITQAVVGIAIMSIAYLIIYTIEVFTGVTVTTFTLPSFQ